MVRKLYFIMATILGLAFGSCTNDANEDIIADVSGTLSNNDAETIELKSGFTRKKMVCIQWETSCCQKSK